MAEEKIEKVIGIDAGYGYIKAFDGKDQVIIPSIIAPARDIKFLSRMRKQDELSNLKVKVGDDWYFVGTLAKEQGKDPIQVLDRNKVFHIATKVSMLVGLGYLAKNNSNVKVVTGLPVSHFNPKEREALELSIKGKQRIEFDYSLIGGKVEVVEFNVTEVKILPQPIGSLFNMIMDDKGNVMDDMVDMASGTVAVLDIGFGTTDLLVMKELDFVDKSSRSINIGVKDIMDDIREQLVVASSEEVPLYEIEATRETKSIFLKGKTYDLSSFYQRSCNSIFTKIKTICDAIWDREQTIGTYIITGGGVHLVGNLFKSIYGTRVNVHLINDAQFANVKGYYKYVKKQ